MWRNLFIAAVICVLSLVANADVLVTLNGDNLTDAIAMSNYPGQLVVAVEGNTPVGPNDISIEAQNGTLEPGEPNGGYYFRFITEGEAAVNLITNVDMVIDGNSIPANTLIYQLWLYYNPDANIYAAFGIGLAELLTPVEEEAAQGELLADDLGEPVAISVPEEPNQPQLQTAADYNTLPLMRAEQHPRKVLLHCPNNVDEIIPAPVLSRETESAMMYGEGGGGMLLLDGAIDVNSDITTNQIWTAGNTYHITTDISVQALLVIEPGTIILYAYDTGMFVNNGGTLISSGTPDNPIIYTSDAQYPGYGDYYCPIYIEETASPATKVTYNYIEYAEIGIIVLNNRLDNDIENNYLSNNVYGIVEYGTAHTNITNNLVYGTYYNAIEVHMASLAGQGDANSIITIQNNTCDYYQDFGIAVVGVANPDDAGWVVLTNNIVSGAYCGIYMLGADEYAYGSVANTGYYDNTYNKSWEFPEDSPVQQTNWPYVDGTGTLPVCYLKQDCNFINAGYEYIEGTRLIGKTTDVNSFPDSNKTDIGFHYPNWDYTNTGDANSLSFDLDGSMRVDFRDFVLLAAGWRTIYDIDDLNKMADEWLHYAGGAQIQITGDSNSGYVDVGVIGWTPDMRRIFLLVNGKYFREFYDFRNGDTLTMDISQLGNGGHQLKVVSVDKDRNLICSSITNISFSCPLNYCVLPANYEPNKPCYFAAFNPTAGDVSVKVYADGGNLVWSQAYSGNSIFGSIPAGITIQHELDYVNFTCSEVSISKVTGPAPIVNTSYVKALIITPDMVMNLWDCRTRAAVKKAFKDKGIIYEELFGQYATDDAVAHYAEYGNVKYIYFAAHGGYRLQNGVDENDWALRTYIDLYDYRVVSIKQSDFAPGQAPSWCEDLGIWEDLTRSFFSMGFRDLEFVYANVCYGGRLKINSSNQLVEGQRGEVYDFDAPQSDMSIALGMGDTSKSRFYQGWHDESTVYRFWLFETEYQKWNQLEWEQLGNGENLYWALYYTIEQQTDFSPEAPVYNYVLRGQGYFEDIVLDNW